MKIFAILLVLAVQDADVLQWSFQKDQTIKLVWTTTMKQQLLHGGKEYGKQEEKEKVEYLVRVLSVADDGTAVLRFTVNSLERETTNIIPSNRLTIQSKRVEGADPEVKVTVDCDKMTSPAKTASRRGHELVYKNLYAVQIDVTVDRYGVVKDKKAEGDLFKGLVEDDVQSKFLAQHLRRDLTTTDLASCLVAQAFLHVPGRAAKVGESWKTNRSFGRRCADLKGELDATVKSRDSGFVEIVEKGEIRIDGTRYKDSMVETMNLMRPEANFKMSMDQNAAWPVTATWWFNAGAARVETFSLKGRYVLKGEYSGKAGEQIEEKSTELIREVEFGVRWK